MLRTDLRSYMVTRRLRGQPVSHFAAIVLLVIMVATAAVARAQDHGVADTVRFLAPELQPIACSDSLRMNLPIHLFSDQLSELYAVLFGWNGTARLDTIVLRATGTVDSIAYRHISIDNENHTGHGALGSWTGSFTPCNETAVELLFSFSDADTLRLDFSTDSTWGFQLRLIFGEPWRPSVTYLDTSFVLPETLLISPGDADGSGLVNISDCVYLISYIFGGGCPPYDLNSADVDLSCAVNVSDAVYLIAYVFGGGPAPNPGCVYPG